MAGARRRKPVFKSKDPAVFNTFLLMCGMSAAWGGWLGLNKLVGHELTFITYDLALLAWFVITIDLLYSQYCHKLTNILASIQCGYALMIACYTVYMAYGVKSLEPIYNNWQSIGLFFTALNILAFAWRWLNVERVAGKSQGHSADSYSGVQCDSSVLAHQQAEEGA